MNPVNLVRKAFFLTAHIGLIAYYSHHDLIFRPDRDKIVGPKLPPNPKAGNWHKEKPLPSYRYEFSSASIGGIIYVIGGIREPNVWFPTSLAEAYNTKTKKWIKIKKLPRPLHHIGIASDDKYLYVVGGNKIRISPSESIYRYNPQSNIWDNLPDMPTPRGALGAAIIKNKLYAVGGADYGKKYALLEELDLETMKWQRLSDMPTPREHLTCAVSQLGLHALGGYNTDRFGSMTTHEIYNVDKKKWHTAAPIPMPICGMMTAVVNDNVYVIGGEQGWAVSKYVFKYDGKKDCWTRVPDLKIPRYAGSASVVDNKIHVIGGCEKMFSHHFSHSHDVFTPSK